MKLTNKLKALFITTLVVILAGMVILGVFGFNNTVDYSNSYELNVKVEQSLSGSKEIMLNTSREYFAEKGINEAGYSYQEINEGETLVFKFNGASETFKNATTLTAFTADLKAKIETAFNTAGGNLSGLSVTVSAYESVNVSSVQLGYTLLAGGLAIVGILIYLLIMEKVAGALSVIASIILSVFFNLSLLAITRIPAQPFAVATIVLSAVVTAVLSTVLVNRCKEALKADTLADGKLTVVEIAEKSVKKSFFGIVATAITVAISGILFLALGPQYIRILGLQLILSGVSIFGATLWTQYVWSFLKKK